MDLENLYLKSPIFIQSLLINIQGLKIKRTRFNADFQFYFNQYLNSDPYKTDQEQLYAFLNEAQKTKYWNAKFKLYHLKINQSTDIIKEVQKLPLLTKQEVKNHLESIVNTDLKEKTSNGHTSGTTGSGMIFPQTLSMENKQWAIWWRYRNWHGISTDTWMGLFGGRSIVNTTQKKPPYWRVSYPTKQVLFSAHHLNEMTVKYYYNEILRRKLMWLHGYPSQLSLLASLFRKQNLNPKDNIKFITVGAENLLARQKAIIEEVFQAPVRQNYGLAEGAANISEHSDGSLLPDLDFALIEFIPVDPSDPSTCKIIGTNYNNLAFPLIRYDTGDIIKIDWQPDGRPKIISIDGRMEDYIILPNGVKLGRLDHIFKNLTEIEEAQITQLENYNIVIKIVKSVKYRASVHGKKLMLEIRKRLGDDIPVSIIYVDTIPRDSTGKLRFVISNIKSQD